VSTFFGSYEHAVDERGRIAVPARFRKSFLEDGAVVRAGPERCVEVYTAAGFRAETERRLGDHQSTRDRDGRRVRRAFLTNAFEIELDRQGRILVPQALRSHCELGERVVINGCGDYIEIWDPQRWEGELSAVEASEAAGGDA
jgi:MraZ protein